MPTAVGPFLDLVIVITATWNTWKEDSSSEKKIKLDNKTLQLVSDGGNQRHTSNKVYARDGSFLIPLLSDLLLELYLSLYQYHTITKNKRLSLPYFLQVTTNKFDVEIAIRQAVLLIRKSVIIGSYRFHLIQIW